MKIEVQLGVILLVSLYLKETDFVKIQRENKINSLLKNN